MPRVSLGGCLVFFGGDAVLFDFLVQRVAVDSEFGGGFGLHAAARVEDLDDQFFFDTVDDDGVGRVGAGVGFTDAAGDDFAGERFDVAGGLSGGIGSLVVEDTEGEQVDGEFVGFGHDDGAFDVVLQFADVPRPMVILERVEGSRSHVGDVAVVDFVVVIEEERDQRGDIVATLSERWDFDRDDVESPVEVFAEAFFADLLHQVSVAGGDDPGVGVEGAGIADPFELFFLQHAEQFDLQGEGGAVDFVEEDCPAVGRFEAAGSVGDRAGERAADVAEEFAFEQAFAERPAVDADEGSAAATAEPMDGAGDQFFADAGLAEDQHRGVAAGDPSSDAIDLLHRWRIANDAGDWGATGAGRGNAKDRHGEERADRPDLVTMRQPVNRRLRLQELPRLNARRYSETGRGDTREARQSGAFGVGVRSERLGHLIPVELPIDAGHGGKSATVVDRVQ